MVEQALRNLLLATGSVTSLVGERIHPMAAPQAPANPAFPQTAALPAVTYSDSSRKTQMTYDGPILLDKYGITIQSYAKSYGVAKAIGKAIRDRLLGYRGEATGGRILGIFDEDESDELELPIHDEEKGIYYVTLSLIVWYRGASPGGD